LKVTIGTGFGLGADDVSYWGNARAEGLSLNGINLLVNATDVGGVRDNPQTIIKRDPVDDAYDYNKDSLVNATDAGLSRDNQKTLLNCVKLITR
jgi:hypothetical protein